MGNKKDKDEEYDPRLAALFVAGLAYGCMIGWYYGKDAGKSQVYEQQEKHALKNRLWELESAIATLHMQAQEREAANGSPS